MKNAFQCLLLLACLLASPAGAAQAESRAGFIEAPEIADEFMDTRPVVIGEAGTAMKDHALLDFGSLPSRRLFKQSGRHATPETSARGPGDRIILVTPALMAFRDYKIPELEAYLRTITNDVHARTVLGVRLYQDGQIDESLAVFRQAQRINPWEERTAELHSGILMQQKVVPFPAGVAAEIYRLLDAHPGNHVIRFNLACALARSGQANAALAQLEVLDRAMWPELVHHMTDPDFASIRNHQGFIRLQNQLLDAYRDNLNRYLLGSLNAPSLTP